MPAAESSAAGGALQPCAQTLDAADHGLYGGVRGGGARRHAHALAALEPLGPEVVRALHVVGDAAFLLADVQRVPGVGAAAPADDEHEVHLLGQLASRCLLT